MARKKCESFKVFLDGRDVTPLPLVFVTSDDSLENECANMSKLSDLPKQMSGLDEKTVDCTSESISSGSSSSSQFRQSLTSPRDLGHIEMPYSDSVMEKFLEGLHTPPPKDEVVPEKVSQERLLELLETKPMHPMKVILSLKETSTFFLLDRPSLTALEGTEEAELIKKDNALYDYLTIGEGRHRYTKNAETQTKWKVWKSKSVWAPAAETIDNIAEASTYDLYQSFKDDETS